MSSGGLYYPAQNNLVLIGTKNETTFARTPATLTTTNTDNQKTFETAGMAKMNLSILYTTGAGETNNTIDIVLQGSPDRTNFYQLTNEGATLGASVMYQRTFQFTGALAATAYSFTIGIDVFYRHMKLLVSEGGVVTNAGTAFIEATLSGR